MEYERAVALLQKLAERYPLSADEKEAIGKAVALLHMGLLAEKQIKARGARRDQNAKW